MPADATVGIRLTGITESAVAGAMQLLTHLNITWGVLRQEEKKYWYVIGRINNLKETKKTDGGSYIPKEETVRWD